MKKLKPIKCDCGNTYIDIFSQTNLDGDGIEFVCMCQSCKRVVIGDSLEKAILAWNRRSK